MSRRILAGLTSTAMILAVQPAHPDLVVADHVVINEVYDGGGNPDVTLIHDVVKLLNPASSDISVGGWKMEYLTAKDRVDNTCTL